MKPEELRKLTAEELTEKIAKAKEELNAKRFDIRLAKEKNTAGALSARKEIARMMTILKEKLLNS